MSYFPPAYSLKEALINLAQLHRIAKVGYGPLGRLLGLSIFSYLLIYWDLGQTVQLIKRPVFMALSESFSSHYTFNSKDPKCRNRPYLYKCCYQLHLSQQESNSHLLSQSCICRGSQWICSSKYVFFGEIFADWEIWEE